jgi:D-alanyl-D-alanine carboxypeptidase
VSYSNTNYVLLGLVVEAVTGHPLAAELQRRIFNPLGLRDTSFASGAPIRGPHAHGYDLTNTPGRDMTALSPSWGWAAGAIVSTADDLARFYQALLQGRLLRPAQLAAMEAVRPMGAPYPASDRYGLGLWQTRSLALARGLVHCGAVWGHNGGMPGYTTNAFGTRDGKRVFVLLVNAEPAPPRTRPAIVKVLAAAACP